tara:strand:- start:392 stop:706 length:315 start_codon:yes stop_codon:yes gene_type:complete
MKATYFLNYINGQLSLDRYRNVSAVVTGLEDIKDAVNNDFAENLTATVNQTFQYDEDLQIATFTGITYDADNNFDICNEEEAHNVSLADGMRCWGLEDDLSVDV